MKQIIGKISLLIMLATCFNSAEAAPDKIRVDTSDANESLKDLQSLLANNYLGCFATYFREYVDSSGAKIRDSSYLSYYSSYKTSFRYAYTRMYPNPGIPPTYKDEVHLQNDREHITVEDSMKLIFINKRISLMQAFFQIDLLDPQFVQDNVQRMYAIDSSGSKVIKAEFKPESPYLSYWLSYDTASLNPQRVSFVRKLENGSSTAAYDMVEISFIGHTTYHPDPTFPTDKYFTRINGVYVLKPAYADYEIVDLSAY